MERLYHFMGSRKLDHRIVGAADFHATNLCSRNDEAREERLVESFELPISALGVGEFDLNEHAQILNPKESIWDSAAHSGNVPEQYRGGGTVVCSVYCGKDVVDSLFITQSLLLRAGTAKVDRSGSAESHVPKRSAKRSEAPRGPWSPTLTVTLGARSTKATYRRVTLGTRKRRHVCREKRHAMSSSGSRGGVSPRPSARRGPRAAFGAL